jgi:diguanylate cyclase (GGDEF)-like protein
LRVTISLGVAANGPDPLSAAELLQRADAKLYQAKDAGRNCVVA